MMFLLFSIILTTISSDVNVYSDGEAWECNMHPFPKYGIHPLSSTDLSLINKLEQVQLMFRHGLRVLTIPFDTYFPKSNVSFTCNVSTITTRNFAGENIDIEDQDTLNMITLNKIYAKNEQRLRNTNCEWTQSLQLTYHQLQENTEIILDAYIGSNTHNIMTQDELYETLTASTTLKLISTDYERTLSSLTAFLYGFKNYNNGNNSYNSDFNDFDVIIHDTSSDPLSATGSIECLNNPDSQFSEWTGAYNDDPNIATSRLREKYVNEEFVKSVEDAFVEQGGVWNGGYTGYELLFYYCDGITIPIESETWWNMVNISYKYDTLIDDSDYGLDKQYCYYHTVTLPMLQLFKNEMEKLVNNDENMSRFVVYSGHGDTMRNLLAALRIWNFEPVANGEMVTLEIYSANLENQWIIDNGIEYLFRWTRKGETLKYPKCEYVEGVNDELCDLRILFDEELMDVMSLKEWESNICINILDECRCGYCKSDNNDNNDDEGEVLVDWKSSTFIIAIITGFVIGVLISFLIVKIQRYCVLQEENQSLWNGSEERELSDYQTYPKMTM